MNTEVYGSGSISISPVKSEYDLRDTVTLTASSAEGHVFRKWGGDISSSQDTTVEVVITSDMEISAFFTPEGELITNGDFSSGSQGWDAAAGYEGGQSSGCVENGEYHVSITNGGDVNYAV
ncbi:MAG: InlB B-repeat-containing protein, partial [Chitinivibrionales bacterium]